MATVITKPPYNCVGDGKKVTSFATMAVGSAQIKFADPLFVSTDKDKYIFVVRTDVYGGLQPWFEHVSPQGAAQIVSVIDAYTITLNVTGSSAPGISFPAQAWPYNNTPCYVLWGTDNSAGLQAALNAGGDVFVPDTGIFCWAFPVAIGSNTSLRGYSLNSTLMPLAVNSQGWVGTGPAGGATVVPAICTNGYKNYFVYGGALTGNIDQRMVTQGDVNISLSSLTIDMTAASPNAGTIAFRSFLLNGFKLENCNCIGNPYIGYEGPNCVATYNILIANNTYTNTFSAFSPWTGCKHIKVVGNNITIPYNGSPVQVSYGMPECNGIEINIVGTLPADVQMTYDVLIDSNIIYSNGAALAAYAPSPISVFPDGADCVYYDTQITNNKIYCTNAHNQGIYASGGCDGLVVQDNLITGCDGGQGPYIFNVIALAGEASAPGNDYHSLVEVSSTYQSSTMTVHWTGHGYTGYGIAVVPMLFQPSGGPVVAGVSLNGAYEILAVVDADHFTINARQSATSTTTVQWNGAFADLAEFPQNAKIAGNTLVNCTAPSNALMDIAGINNTISGNTVTYHNGVAANIGQFLIIRPIVGDFAPGSAINNTGPLGTSLPSGYGGTAKICWPPFTAIPAVQDSNSSATATGDAVMGFMNNRVQVGNVGTSVYVGLGVPTFSATTASLYLNASGASGSLLYACLGGTSWKAIG